MLLQRSAGFSPDNKYFATFSCDDKLLVWETFSNVAIIDCKLDSSVYGVCTSLLWIPLQNHHSSPKKVRLTRSSVNENQILALGTNKGDIILYNVTAQNLYSHLVARHSDSVNDMCYCTKTNSFFTCSSDKSIAIWDIMSGRQKSKWTADDAPVISICVLDANNLLSANTSILWWNISKKSILKKFNSHSTEIIKILPVNADLSLKLCYFLSAAVGDSNINAWSLSSTDCEVPVASFVVPGHPQAMDISNVSSKDKPLILVVITKEGQFNLFEHTLNGNVNQPLHPKTTFKIAPDPSNSQLKASAIISTKLSSNSEDCIIAYGTSKDCMVFKHIKIKKPPKECNDESVNDDSVISNTVCTEDRLSPLKVRKISINGVKSPENSPKPVRFKESNSCSQKRQQPSTVRKIKSSSQQTPVPVNKLPVEDASKSRSDIRDIDITDPESTVGMLLKGLQSHNRDLIDIVFHSGDAELICSCVESLPQHTLRYVLEELSSRLRQNQRSSPTFTKWLKEILRIHLKYLTETQDTFEILNCIKEGIEARKIQETVSKMSALKGLLSLQVQNASSDESETESEESDES